MALVITIVVLIILAGVTINMLLGNDGIIARAKYARESYENATNEEQEQIANAEAILAGNLTNVINDEGKEDSTSNQTWTYNHTNQTVSNQDNTIILKIGDYINYTAPTTSGYSGKWRVLGAEDGKLLLVSSTNVSSEQTTLNGSDVSLGQTGQIWGDILNNLCTKYADGTKTENGRSIKVEDINKITGYNPRNIGVNDYSQTGIGTPYGNEKITQYGNRVVYKKISETQISYSSDIASGTMNYKKFQALAKNELAIDEEYVVDESTLYGYDPSTLTGTALSEGDTIVGISNASSAWDMLFKGTSDKTGNTYINAYWVASPYVHTAQGSAAWGVRTVVAQFVQSSALWNSASGTKTVNRGIRAVVTLKSNILPTLDETIQADSTGSLTYNI